MGHTSVTVACFNVGLAIRLTYHATQATPCEVR